MTSIATLSKKYSISEHGLTVLFSFILALGIFALSQDVFAVTTGTTTIFDSLATNTTSALGPLGQAIIITAAAAGGIFALIKGAWIMAGMGIAVAGLMFGAKLVAGSAGFGALI